MTPKLIRCQNRALRCNWAMHYFPPRLIVVISVLISLWLEVARAQTGAAAVGAFVGHTDVGATRRAGSVESDAARRSYSVAGGGENMWFTNDAFHFVWKKISGDVTLAADVAFVAAGGNPHRKACLMLRQSLDADSAYADAALHGNGLTSLQSRDEKGAATHEIQSNVSAPKRLRITRLGNYIHMSVAAEGEELRPSGGAMRV